MSRIHTESYLALERYSDVDGGWNTVTTATYSQPHEEQKVRNHLCRQMELWQDNYAQWSSSKFRVQDYPKERIA